MTEARGKSRRALELVIARWFPRPDVAAKIQTVATTQTSARSDTTSGPSAQNTCPGAGDSSRFRLEPLSPERYRVEFTASVEFRCKLERARELLSHSVPNGDIAVVLERALDQLIERELKRRAGSDKPRKRRTPKAGSRHVPVKIARQVRERDGGQCAFVDADGRRCSERRFLTLEHREPFALGGPPTVENLCLYCSAHNAHTARRVFGAAFIAEKRAARAKPAAPEVAKPDAFERVLAAMCNLGFRRRQAAQAVAELRRRSDGEAEPELAPLIRAALDLLTTG